MNLQPINNRTGERLSIPPTDLSSVRFELAAASSVSSQRKSSGSCSGIFSWVGRMLTALFNLFRDLFCCCCKSKVDEKRDENQLRMTLKKIIDLLNVKEPISGKKEKDFGNLMYHQDVTEDDRQKIKRYIAEEICQKEDNQEDYVEWALENPDESPVNKYFVYTDGDDYDPSYLINALNRYIDELPQDS